MIFLRYIIRKIFRLEYLIKFKIHEFDINFSKYRNFLIALFNIYKTALKKDPCFLRIKIVSF